MDTRCFTVQQPCHPHTATIELRSGGGGTDRFVLIPQFRCSNRRCSTRRTETNRIELGRDLYAPFQSRIRANTEQTSCFLFCFHSSIGSTSPCLSPCLSPWPFAIPLAVAFHCDPSQFLVGSFEDGDHVEMGDVPLHLGKRSASVGDVHLEEASLYRNGEQRVKQRVDRGITQRLTRDVAYVSVNAWVKTRTRAHTILLYTHTVCLYMLLFSCSLLSSPFSPCMLVPAFSCPRTRGNSRSALA